MEMSDKYILKMLKEYNDSIIDGRDLSFYEYMRLKALR